MCCCSGYAARLTQLVACLNSYRAYTVLKNNDKELDLRRKRKLRYLKLKNQIKVQEDPAFANRKI